MLKVAVLLLLKWGVFHCKRLTFYTGSEETENRLFHWLHLAVSIKHLSVHPSFYLSHLFFLTLMRSVEFDIAHLKMTHQRAAQSQCLYIAARCMQISADLH